MWGVLCKVKSLSEIFKSSYGGKLFLHICKLEWFKRKEVWVDGSWKCFFIYSKGSYWESDTRFSGGNWFMKKTWSWKSLVRLPLKGFKFWQRPRGQGFWLCDVACLVMYRTASTHLRGLLYPFLYSMGLSDTWCQQWVILIGLCKVICPVSMADITWGGQIRFLLTLLLHPGFRIRIDLMRIRIRIRIQHFF